MTNPQLFHKTRLQLAGWYATGMGIMLSIVGGYIYVTTNQTYWAAVHQELISLTGNLHDSLEPKLKIPGVVDPAIQREVLSNICLVNASCPVVPKADRHTLGISQQRDYYLRLYNLDRQLLATAGQQPAGASISDGEASLVSHHHDMSFHDAQGVHYHQLTIALTTFDGRPWGLLQVGRSMQEFDDRVASLQLQLLVVLPAITGLVAVISWWLAGKAMQPIYQSYAKMQQFTADAAHELRTPLSAMLATVEAAQDPDSIEEAVEALETVERQTDRLIHLAEDLLLLSSLENLSDDRGLSETCQLDVIVVESVKNMQSLAVSAGIDLHVVMLNTVPLWVRMVDVQAQRLLTNLIVNALQHTPQAGTVTVVLQQINSYAVIQVQDTGVGIDPDLQSHIFDRFYRVNSARTRQKGGAGLGLAIAQEIVRVHQGAIEVQSKLGEGSNFIVKLPRLF